MTIAEYIAADRTMELMEELREIAPAGSFLCEGVSYMVPDKEFHLTERRWLKLSS